MTRQSFFRADSSQNQLHSLQIVILVHIWEGIFQKTQVIRHIIIFNAFDHRLDHLEQLPVIGDVIAMQQAYLMDAVQQSTAFLHGRGGFRPSPLPVP